MRLGTCGDASAMGIAAVDDQKAIIRAPCGEFVERRLDRVDVLVVIEVIFFDIEDRGAAGLEIEERTVVFAGFGAQALADSLKTAFSPPCRRAASI